MTDSSVSEIEASNLIYDVNPLYGVASFDILNTGTREIDALIYNLIRTPRQSRRFQPNAGSRLMELLQEPRDSRTAQIIEMVLRQEITEQVVRASVSAVQVDTVRGGYRITVSYFDRKTGVSRNFEAKVSP